MKLTQISIKVQEYGPNKGKYVATATCEAGASYGAKIEIDIPDEMLTPIVDILAQAVAESMRLSAIEFAQDVAASLMPPVEHVAIEGDAA